MEKNKVVGNRITKKSNRSKILEAYACKDKSIAQRDLKISGNEKVVLSRDEKQFNDNYKELKIRTADEARDIFGIPESVGKKLERNLCLQKMRSPVTGRLGMEKIDSKLLSGDIFKKHNPPEDQLNETIKLTRMALEAYVYFDHKGSYKWKKTIEEFLDYSDFVVHLPFFRDIIINDGGALVVDYSTFAVYARDVKIYGSGKIICNGPTTFDCRSIQGIK